ncbi:MAG: DUF4159 domain-containing protein [Hyphomicrobiales bacterium]|nr:DUF4159 domain-containing protein [Hyphomicrobiales bacterium]MCP5371066.1 DUF4159 domain-containing protein [Hyphomicrobiales bacterium]
MLELGPIAFLSPLALAGLLVLPAIWLLLRLTPPAPRRFVFPPVRLLRKLASVEETAVRTPWWMILLRLALAVAVILGAAHPLLFAPAALQGSGPLVLFVDDGWAAAARWPARADFLARQIDQAERQGRPVMIETTARRDGQARVPVLESPAEARRRAAALRPRPWETDRAAALERLARAAAAANMAGAQVIWVSDGLDDGAVDDTVRALRALGPLTMAMAAAGAAPVVLMPPHGEGAVLKVTALRVPAPGVRRVWIQALDEQGQPIAREGLDFAADTAEGKLDLELPSQLRNRAALLRVEDQATAGGVVLLDERWRRRPVGISAAEGGGAAQPLLSETYYLDRALQPFTEVLRGSVADLIARGVTVLALTDSYNLEGPARGELAAWVEGGGVLLRFAGPRLAREAAQGEDPLLPVLLRRGDRSLGGSLSWGQPAALAPFPDASPFAGLDPPEDVRVRQQILAQPTLELAERTWARLRDGTPLVTARARGDGWVVLVHTTANTAWSNLAISGLFVDMLRRVVALSHGVSGAAKGPPLAPQQTLDAFGDLGPPPPEALPIAAADFADTRVGPSHPPGVYGTAADRRALNLSASLQAPRAIVDLPPAVAVTGLVAAPELDFRPWLLVAALVLALVDTLASLALRGHLRARTAGPAALGLLLVLAVPAPAPAQGAPERSVPPAPGVAPPPGLPPPAAQPAGEDFLRAASLTTRLAYVVTGDPVIDDASRAGLFGLSGLINRRTAIELGEPMGIDPESQDLSLFPLLYWPVTADQPPPTALAAERINEFMRNSGVLLVDSRQRGGEGTDLALARMERLLDVPPLVPVTGEHVLSRSFYLLKSYPGRWAGGQVWITRPDALVNDGVSPIVVGGNDWAGAWAVDRNHRPLFAVVPGGERQRELAYRFGVNLVMYALTGNYKADQVHLPAIIERLGR